MNQYDNTPNDGIQVEKKKRLFMPNPALEASTLSKRLSVEGAPADYYAKVFEIFKGWQLTSADQSSPKTYEELELVLKGVRKFLDAGGSKPFYDAYGSNPWQYGYVEGEYSPEEISVRQPTADEISNTLNENIRCFYRIQSAENPLTIIEREDGRRQVMRIIETEKTSEEIELLSTERPDMIPAFEGVRLKDGRTALMISWIEGNPPQSTEERQRCADQLPTMNRVPSSGYDFGWIGNFVIEQKTRLPYFIDSEAIMEIIKLGYQRPTKEIDELLVSEKSKLFN